MYGLGFQARNHPQQVAKRGVCGATDDRATRPEVFEPLDAEFGPFTLDAAAAPHNAKCARYFTREQDGLRQSWRGERVWINPPYSGIGAWVEKAVRETESGGCQLAVMLIPNNRCEQRWWQEHVEPVRDRGLGVAVRFLPGRPRFIAPESVRFKHGDRPPFGLVVVVFTPPSWTLL